MGFASAVYASFANYATFSTRTGRAEFWYFMLFLFLVNMAAAVVDVVAFGRETGPASILAMVLLLVPELAALFRRLHDRECSGAGVLLLMVPLVGWLLLIALTLRKGTAGPNRYGPPPVAAPRPQPAPAA